MTLLEVLLVVMLTAMIMGPLTAWWLVATRQQPLIARDSSTGASTALLSRQLVRDIAVAGGAATDEAMTATLGFNFEDCRGGGGAGGRVVLVLVRGGLAELTKTVYAERVEGDTTSLWRRTCDAGTGLDARGSRVVDSIEPGATATCDDADDGSVCRNIEFRVRASEADPVVLRGVRRVDIAAVAADVGGLRAPIAKITVASQTDERPYAVEFSAETSSDPDGSIACYQWVFTTVAEGRGDPSPAYVTVEVPDPSRNPADGSPCPERDAPVVETAGDPGPSGDLRRQLRILPTSGVYFVELIVTDSDGLSSTTYKRFEIEPRSPVAEARVTPVAGGTGAAGTTVFELAARWAEDGVVQGTRHPDGTLVEYRWTLTGSGLVYEAVRSTPDPWYLALPPVMAGNVAVTLVVTDDEGRSATAATGIVLEPQPADQAIAEGTMWPAGAQLPPANLRLAGPAGSVGGAQVTWDPAPQADRYVVEVDPGCAPGVLRAVTPPGELTAAVLPARCVGSDQVRVRVAAELAGALSAWSGWLDVTLPVTAADPAEVEVVSPFEEAGG